MTRGQEDRRPDGHVRRRTEDTKQEDRRIGGQMDTCAGGQVGRKTEDTRQEDTLARITKEADPKGSVSCVL